MRKLLLGAAVALPALAVAAPAQAEDWYVKASVGVTEDVSADLGSGFELPLDGGLAYGAAIGASFANGLRIEGEVNRAAADLSLMMLDTDSTYYGGAVYLDFNRDGKFQPFIGAGYGYMETDATLFTAEASGDGMVWHYDVGAAYRVSDSITAEVSYRHVEGEQEFDFGGGGMDVDVEADQIMAALRFKLG